MTSSYIESLKSRCDGEEQREDHARQTSQVRRGRGGQQFLCGTARLLRDGKAKEAERALF